MQRHPILLPLSLFVLAFSAASAFPEPLEKVDRHTYTEDTSSVRVVSLTGDLYGYLCVLRFDEYKFDFGLVINSDEEEARRLDAFCKTREFLFSNNRPNEAFRVDINQFTAMTVDWREAGILTPVLEQGSCGSGWAFSAAGALASHFYLQKKNKTLLEFSEQELIDCSTKYGNSGCGGGLMSNAFDYVKEAGGIETSRDYSYEGKDAECRQTKEAAVTSDSGFIAIPSGNEDALREAVARVGPVSVAITVTKSFFSYSYGVFYDERCDDQELNHGVLLVGFGTDPVHGDYWLVKNSWGEQWGEQGYIRLSRSKGKACGIAREAAFPVIV